MRKFFEFNSIRSRMLAGFLALTFLIFLIAVISLFTLDNIRYTANIDRSINQLQANVLILIKSDNDFFDLGVIDTTYFRTRKSHYLQTRDSLNQRIKSRLTQTLSTLRGQSESIVSHFELIERTLAQYNSEFDQLEELLFKRGFRGFGLEGVMRSHAHLLERKGQSLSMAEILSLRRLEKDFFLRHDFEYVIGLNDLANELRAKLTVSNIDQHTLQHLNAYVETFNQLVAIHNTIGLDSNSGLRNRLNKLTGQLSSTFFELAEFSSQTATATQRKAFLFYGSLITVAVLISLFSSFWLAKKLSSPIARLSRLIDQAVSEHNVIRIKFAQGIAAQEINTLTSSFNSLIDEVGRNVKELEKKSALLRQRNQQLKKLNRELDSFLYSTAHDLRSPLTSLLGLLYLAKKENTTANLDEYFLMMENSIHRMEEFISQIVGYSKNKRLEVRHERIDLQLMLREVHDNHRFAEGANKIEMDVTVVEEVPFYSDRGRVMILLNNLMSNAIRYADHTKTSSFIKVDATISEDTMKLEFSDNGQGIAEEHLDKIFEMFYRANTKSKGSGLGLFIFMETLNRLKGKVSVESKLGVGTTFYMRIPNFVHQQNNEKLMQAAS
jgi:signal transduction histidine kinase